MTRNFYSSANFFAGLYTIIVLLRTIIDFQFSTQVLQLPSYAVLIFIEALTSITWSMILLKYFHHKGYRLTFWVMTVSILAALFHLILVYDLLKTRAYTDSYILAILALLVTSVFYGMSLILSEAGRRPWLKKAGILTVFLGLIMLASTVWAFNSITVIHDGSITTISQWVSLLSSLVPILFIMNFLDERSTVEEEHAPPQEILNSVMNIVVFIAVMSTLFFGSKIVFESIQLHSDPAQVSEDLKTIAQPFEARTYTNTSGSVLPYRLLKPLDYDSSKTYPLVVCLHGSSGRGTDNTRQISSSIMPQMLSIQENRAKYPAFLFVPQCPPEMDWGGITNIPSVDSLVFESISALEEEFSIDADRRYVVGVSMGGYGTWHLITTRPELFAAAIPIAGGGNPALAQNIINLPIWAFHGAKDRNVLVRGSRDMIESIKNEGGDPRYTEFPDKAHHISDELYRVPSLLDWLFSQKRE